MGGEMRVNEVYEGDCLDVMRGFPDNCVDSIITDPPYGLQFMGKNWDHGIPGIPYWAEALRIAKPGATLLAFGGTRTYHRLTCAIEDAGWEIRDCISYFHDGTQAERAFMASLSEEQLGAYLELHRPGGTMGWVYGSGMGLGENVSKAIDEAKGAEREVVGIKRSGMGRNGRTDFEVFHSTCDEIDKQVNITTPATPLAKTFSGYNTRLKPAVEFIVLAMAPMESTFAANAEEWGVSGLNIDGCRVEYRNGLTPDDEQKKYKGKGGSTSAIFGNTGLEAQNPSHPKGRWPANLIWDGSEEVKKEFDKAGVRSSSRKLTKPGTKTALGQGSGWNDHNNKDRTFQGLGDSGTPARFFQQCPPDSEPARFRYCPKAPKSERATAGNNHPTQKPLSLMRYLAKLTRPPDGGIVLDPFGGSGTTALAAIAEGRDYIIIEKESEYAELCRRRIAEYTGQEVAPVEHKVSETETAKQMSLW